MQGGGAGEKVGVAALQPEKKVVLLCGPPGLGKTTLAHVVARHCGYHPYEINASDDRTAATLTERVQDAVQMQPVLGQRRPNCVIIDEIDGATGGQEGHGAIAALLAIVNATGGGGAAGAKQGAAQPGARGGGGGAKEGGAPRRRGGKRAPPALTRPIICIANDLYAPALRPLREVAQLFHFKPPDVDKLVARLALICEQEKVAVDRSALFALAQRSECDIRTCLNTLQLLAKQQHGNAAPARPGQAPQARRITVQQVEQLNIGSKDTQRSAFGVWDALLQQPKAGAVGAAAVTAPGAVGGGGGGGAAVARGRAGAQQQLSRLYGMMMDLGEWELLMSGLHENLLSLRYLDVHLKNTCLMSDALAEADLLLSALRRNQDYALMAHVPSWLLLVHVLAAQPGKVSLQWPKAQTECGRRAQAQREVLRGWAAHRVTARVLQAHSPRALMLEVVPSLLRLLSPCLRPLAPNLLTPAERAAMASTARVMVDFGLRFNLEEPDVRAGGAGQHVMTRLYGGAPATVRPVPLDPPLDTTQAFAGLSTQNPTAVVAAAQAASASAAAAGDPLRQQQQVMRALLLGEVALPAPLRPVATVLRQLLNQQATLATIALEAKEADAAARMEAQALMSPGAKGPAAAPPPAPPAGVAKLLNVKVVPQAAGAQQAGARQPLKASDRNAQQQGKAAAPRGGKGGHWLDQLRAQAASKRKAGAAATWQQSKRAAKGGEGGDPAAAANSPGPGRDDGGEGDEGGAGPFVKHPVLYRYLEGYTNAVKRPLLINELL